MKDEALWKREKCWNQGNIIQWKWMSGVQGLWLGDTIDEAKQEGFINRAEHRTRKLKENLWYCQEVS